MVYQYVVTLKNTSQKYIDTFSLLILFVSVLLFFREQFRSNNIKITYLFGALAIVAIIARNLYQQKKENKPVFYCRHSLGNHALSLLAFFAICSDGFI
jgi:Na+/glutamate symporter